MTVQQKIGQLMVCGWSDDTPMDGSSFNKFVRSLIEVLQVGGVILFDRNIGLPQLAKSLISQLQSAASAAGIPPLFVAVDQEGGRVSRFKPPYYPAFPAAAEIDQSNGGIDVFINASKIGSFLKEVGVNWNLAPVLDVNNNPKNVVIGDRSFSSDPLTVAALGEVAVRGYQEDAGILACGKHFPGHGDTSVDSHFNLPVIRRTFEQLNQVELIPFKAAILAGIGSIMTSHIVFPEVDPALPATMASKFLTGLLRGTLGYDGLIITDCLEMSAVAAKWGSAEAAVLAIAAGADMVLVSHTLETQIAVRDSVVEAVNSGRLSTQRVDDALNRVSAAKKRWINP